MPTTKNRWLIAASAVAIHISIGSAYAFSVFKRPLGEMHGWSATETSLAFTLAIVFLGASAALFGQFVERKGPRVSALVAATLFSAGHLISAAAAAYGSLPMFYLGYGVIGGIGLGIGYIAPVSTLVKWFPDRRGLATGMAVLGFGAGAMLASPIAAQLILGMGVAATFAILGIGFLLVMTAGALYIERPTEGWLPAHMTNGATPSRIRADLADLTAGEAVRTRRFWLLWTMMFVNISAGIMLISVASPLAQETVGMTAVAAASMVGIMGLFNGVGRIGWAGLSDYIGRQNVYIVFFAAQFVAFLLIPSITSVLLFQALIFMVLTMYGGGFASLPAFIGDLFGTRQLAAIHGLLLTAWSAAGIVGPMAVAFIRDTTGNYIGAFYLFAALLALALVTSLMMASNVRQLRNADAGPPGDVADEAMAEAELMES
jgi:MFS transporter, OFA family, oxalate/formate antiporter